MSEIAVVANKGRKKKRTVKRRRRTVATKTVRRRRSPSKPKRRRARRNPGIAMTNPSGSVTKRLMEAVWVAAGVFAANLGFGLLNERVLLKMARFDRTLAFGTEQSEAVNANLINLEKFGQPAIKGTIGYMIPLAAKAVFGNKAGTRKASALAEKGAFAVAAFDLLKGVAKDLPGFRDPPLEIDITTGQPQTAFQSGTVAGLGDMGVFVDEAMLRGQTDLEGLGDMGAFVEQDVLTSMF